VLSNPIVVQPDWCCEVLSESTEKTDREIKVALYAAAGVEWIWLVDPASRRVEILRTTNGTASLVETLEHAVRRAIPPFASLVDTGRWWASQGP
jgi:Uma2 family endonuclease